MVSIITTMSTNSEFRLTRCLFTLKHSRKFALRNHNAWTQEKYRTRPVAGQSLVKWFTKETRHAIALVTVRADTL